MRSRHIVACCLLFGCASAPCDADGGSPARDAAGLDTAALDAAAPTDAAPTAMDGCSVLRPVRITVDAVWTAVGPGDTRTCTEDGRVRLFRHADGALVFDSASRPRGFRCNDAILELEVGDYDLTMEGETHPQYLMGGDLVRPEHCPPHAPSAPFCAPLRITVGACQDRRVMIVLYCDPAAGECPAAAWPWLTPAP